MQELLEKIETADWDALQTRLDETGFALLPHFLSAETCTALIADYGNAGLYRKTVSMERYRFGKGEYKYFTHPLPPLLQTLRERLYPHLAPVANRWMQALHMEERFPLRHEELLERCRENGQLLATPLILRYGAGGYNTLHQDLYGDVFFPFQALLFLNEPDEDYTGGEFVLSQQNPRAQSQARVLRPRRGDLLIFTTRFRPEKGSKGYRQVYLKHGVSEVHEGTRHTLGIIFHDALT